LLFLTAAQALAHESLALVALQVFLARFRVAALHLLLLRRLLRARALAVRLQAFAHERLALVALERLLAGLSVAALHLFLLRGGLVLVLGPGRQREQRGGDGGDQDAGHELLSGGWTAGECLAHALHDFGLRMQPVFGLGTRGEAALLRPEVGGLGDHLIKLGGARHGGPGGLRLVGRGRRVPVHRCCLYRQGLSHARSGSAFLHASCLRWAAARKRAACRALLIRLSNGMAALSLRGYAVNGPAMRAGALWRVARRARRSGGRCAAGRRR